MGDPSCDTVTEQYDLTGWLPGAMRRGAQAEELDPMREAAINAAISDNKILRAYWAAVWGEELVTTFNDLNTGYGQWDVKQEMLKQLQEGVILCSSDTCRWVDYSVPGNILFGYVAASADVPEDLSTLAGGILEVQDGTFNSENWTNLYEDPYDSAAVSFGYQLYSDYGPNITEEEFNNALTTDILESFQPIPEGFVPPFSPISQNNSYSIGYFDCFAENGCVDPD